MEYLKQFLKEEKIKLLKEFFKATDKVVKQEILKKIEDIDEFLYINEKVNGGI